MNRNARLFGMLVVLGLVLLALVYFSQAAKSPPVRPAYENPDNLPELGHVPTPAQIHGSNPPPPPKKGK